MAMHRLLLIILLLTALAPALPAAAHGEIQLAKVSVQGSEITVRLADAYGSPVPASQISVAASAPGQVAETPVLLDEMETGTYRGSIGIPSGELYDIHIDATVAGEPYLGMIRVKSAADLAETIIPLGPTDDHTKPAPSWSTYLYTAAGVGLLTVTAMALLRRREK